jgi:asparagine synthase (glutamine-hydrolysing)
MGLIHLQMPQYRWEDRPLESWLGKSDRVPGRVPIPGELSPNPPWDRQSAVSEADRILHGEIRYFAHEYHQAGFPPNWHLDNVTLSEAKGLSQDARDSSVASRRSHHPDALRESDMTKHWSQIQHDSSPDIKFIWEPNRFAFIYTLVRAYIATKDEKYAEAFWTLIEDWADHNPPNTGPNWMDGQEIALRLMAWTFGYHTFLNSPTTTHQRKENFILYVAAQSDRIHKNIGYAISTRSNHTISEAFGLWLVGLLFPELKDSEKYLSFGKNLLEQEAARQIFPDGTYSMYSLYYHRFILHIYLYAIRLGELNRVPFSDSLKRAVVKSIEYLSQLIDPQTGQMPVYGSNDGALVLPLNNCDFTDYRPLLQLGWYVTKKEFLFEPGPWDEDIFWLCGADSLSSRSIPAGGMRERDGVREISQSSFPHGGTYLLHNTNSQAFIRCTDFRARPSHADQLHVDLWIHGHNIAVDAGTYLYSGAGIWRNGLAHTSVHNTVTVDGKDQMTIVSRFTWTNWSKGRVLRHDKNLWQGEHDGYKPVSHKRTLMALEGDRWLVIDHLAASESHRYALQWLLNDFPFEQRENSILMSLNGLKCKAQVGMVAGNADFSLVCADPNSTRGWRSRYYGHKEPALSLRLEAYRPRIVFWTFFGFETDMVEARGESVTINSTVIGLEESAS